MRFLLTFALALFPVVAMAATNTEMIDRYYDLRAECRVGDNATVAESAEACTDLNKIGKQLTEAGYCWFKPEQEWRPCD